MPDDAAIWADHEREVAAIADRLREAMMSPRPMAMQFPRFAGLLAQAQAATAERLGKAADDPALKARFEGEQAELRKKGGL